MFAQVGWFFLHLYCWFIDAQERDALLSLSADRKVPQCLQLAEPLTCCLEHRQSFDKGAAAACLGNEIHGVGGNTMNGQEISGAWWGHDENIWKQYLIWFVYTCCLWGWRVFHALLCIVVVWFDGLSLLMFQRHPTTQPIIYPPVRFPILIINWSRLFSFGPEWLLVIIPSGKLT